MSTQLIPRHHVTRVCQIGNGEACCRYLTAGGQGFECAKHTGLRATLDNRAAMGDMVAQSDNCNGTSDIPVLENDS